MWLQSSNQAGTPEAECETHVRSREGGWWGWQSLFKAEKQGWRSKSEILLNLKAGLFHESKPKEEVESVS